MEVSRRQFLQVSGASAAGAVLFNGCLAPEKEMVIESPAHLPEDTINSFENWYASVCAGCGAGCGILVRVIEGRAKKIEGNPDHPLNQGKLCVRGISGVQELYHPDRIRQPLRRSGPRGSGRYEVIGWDVAIDELVRRLKDQATQNAAGTVAMVTEPLSGLSATIVRRFATAYGADYLPYEPMEQTVLRTAVKRIFGEDRIPVFDIEHASYVLSLGANFLEPGLSQVAYNRAYGEFRQGTPGKRGYMVQVEPRLSMTAANADEWVSINPGMEGAFALSIAYVLINENLADRTAAAALTGNAGAAALSAYAPAAIAEKLGTGITADRITTIARDFAKKQPSLAIGGSGAAAHTNGLFNLTAIFALNLLMGNVGKSGGIMFNTAPAVTELAGSEQTAPFKDWMQFTQRIGTKSPRPVNILMVHNANPLYGLPSTVGVDFGNNLKNIPVIISFSSFMDETTSMADLILPDHNYLEAWGEVTPDPGIGFETAGFQQPVVKPMYNTRSFTDVLLTAAEELGGPLVQALPWKSYTDAMKATAKSLFDMNRGSVRAADFDHFWNGVLQRGGWWDAINPRRSVPPSGAAALPRAAVQPTFAGDETQFPFHLVVFPGAGVGDGGGAHLPWLQMTPDPTSTASWSTWVEVNPKTAAGMGLKTNDIVIVESPNGHVEVPVYVYPAIPPNVVAMPAGQGHTFFGRYAEKRGANPMSVVAPLTDADTGALAWGATRVSLKKTGRQYRLPKLEGSVPSVEPRDYDLVQVEGLR